MFNSYWEEVSSFLQYKGSTASLKKPRQHCPLHHPALRNAPALLLLFFIFLFSWTATSNFMKLITSLWRSRLRPNPILQKYASPRAFSMDTSSKAKKRRIWQPVIESLPRNWWGILRCKQLCWFALPLGTKGFYSQILTDLAGAG